MKPEGKHPQARDPPEPLSCLLLIWDMGADTRELEKTQVREDSNLPDSERKRKKRWSGEKKGDRRLEVTGRRSLGKCVLREGWSGLGTI